MDFPAVNGVEICGELHVLRAGEVAIDEGIVAEVSDLRACEPCTPGQRVTEKRDGSIVGSQKRRKHAQKRAFPSAIRADDRKTLTLGHIDVNTSDCPPVVKALLQPTRAD